MNKLSRSLKLVFDNRIPFSYKLVPLAALVYWLFPGDADWFFPVGYLDDAGVMAVALTVFYSMVERKFGVAAVEQMAADSSGRPAKIALLFTAIGLVVVALMMIVISVVIYLVFLRN
jgi:uncharacterized membrane protein YkvA (DUF1232 family)